MYGVKDIITAERKDVHVDRMRLCATPPLEIMADLLDTFTALEHHGEFQI